MSKQWSEVNAYYRFLDNPRISIQSLIDKLTDSCSQTTMHKSVLAIVDTTEINCQGHTNRLESKRGLGPLSDFTTLGYYLQPILCLDAQNKSPLGIAGVHLWNRQNRLISNKTNRYITERESNKWFAPVKEARDSVLHQADHMTFVMDREGDIYEVLESIPNAKTDLVVRSNHNRIVMDGNRKTSIQSYLDRQPIQGQINLKLQSHKRGGQRITADVRFGSVTIPKAKNGYFLPQTREMITMAVVEVTEISSAAEKVHWRLWSSKPIRTLEQAKQIIDIYKSRWHVEELFRLMKTESFDIESSELEKPDNLFKLGIMVMEASLLVQQLKGARDEESTIRVSAIFTSDEIECLKALDMDLKGTTEKQSNPFNDQSLSWASWIIARMGGWKGYKSQRPPGSITYKRGLEHFYGFYEGFQLARLMYKR